MRSAAILSVFVVHLLASSAWGQTVESTPGWSYAGIQSELFGTQFGRQVAVCDADGDGFDDVVAPEPLYFQQTPSTSQQGLVLYFPGGATGLTDWSWFRVGAFGGSTLGFRAGCDGDLNGDGYEDLFFGSGSGFGDSETRMHVQWGSDSGPGGTWDFDLADHSIGVFTLSPSMTTGDFNGDGLQDLAGGFPGYPRPQANGRLVAFYGGVSGLAATPDWQTSGSPGDRLGDGLAAVGDVNGDGYEDLVAADDPGTLYLYLGSAVGLSQADGWTYDVGARGPRVSLAAAGDVNGDGFDDFVVAPYQLEHAGGRGQVQLFLGAASGPASAPSQTLFGNGYFGLGLASAGDVNGDGRDDLLVGATDDESTLGNGRAYLFLGSTAGLNPVPAWFSDDLPGSLDLGSSVDGAGDLNGDGYLDFVAGDAFRGEIHVFFGAAGLSPGAAGVVASSGAHSLRIDRRGDGSLRLDWGESCSAEEEDFAIYVGEIGGGVATLPLTCSTAGRTHWELSAPTGNRFYLTVPQSADREGSYGLDSAGSERLASAAACQPLEPAVCTLE